MSPGVGEEGAKIASNVVSALQSQPVTLAMVVFNVILLFVIYFSNRQESSRIEELQAKLFDQQNKTMEMLYHCVPDTGGNKQ